MAKTRSMTRKLLKINTCDNDGSASWSNLNHDLLFTIIMRVGFFAFMAVSGVCKSWRSIALSNWNKYMVTKQPMHLCISRDLNVKDCYLEEDYTTRKLKTTIPDSNGRDCLGVTCGYLIFYRKKTHDFLLVNPFTRKELHFPGFPFGEYIYPPHFRGILVFSPSMPGWVFVVSQSYSTKISFSLAGEHASWRNRSISSKYYVYDLHFFKGKLYMIDILNHLWELRLNLESTLTLLKMKNTLPRSISSARFLSSGENFYVWADAPYVCLDVDFDEKKWVDSERTIGEYAVFVNHSFKCAATIRPDTWTHPWTQYGRFNYSPTNNWQVLTNTWYFPHECLHDNDTDMENGALLNTLEE